MTYLFTKTGCDKCDWVKSHVKLSELSDLEVLNLDDEEGEGLALLAYYECVSLAEKNLPILVESGGGVVIGAIQIRNHLKRMCG